MLKNKALQIKVKNILPYAILMLLNLRVLAWYEGDHIITSGDFRIPLNPNAYFKNTLYLWNEIDFGMPSIYMPRLLDPISLFTAIFNTMGLSLTYSEILAVYIIETLASIFMYKILLMLLNNTLAALIGAIFFISNIYMINDREATAIGLFSSNLAVLLPSVYFFVKGINRNKLGYYLLSGFLTILASAAYPNYRPYVILIGLNISLLLFVFLNEALIIEYRKRNEEVLYFKLRLQPLKDMFRGLGIYIIGALTSALWIIDLTISNIDLYLSLHKETSIPTFILENVYASDNLRLIARWGFYSGAFNRPYIPYRELYLKDPMFIILSYIPLLIILLSLILSKRTDIHLRYFALLYLTSLALIVIPKLIGEDVYASILKSSFILGAFREPFNYIHFSVFYGSIAVGIGVSIIYEYLLKITKNHVLPLTIVCLIVLTIISSAAPLYTGSVTKNWLRPSTKGTWFPQEYLLIQKVIPENYWSLLLPERGIYQVFNFSKAPFAVGNPHPLIFSKPYISGTGTEYIRSMSTELIRKLYEKIARSEKYCNLLAFFSIKMLIYENKLIFDIKEDIDKYKLEKTYCIEDKMNLRVLSVYEVKEVLDIVRFADTVIYVKDLDDMLANIENTPIEALRHVVFLIGNKEDLKIHYIKLHLPDHVSWSKKSPTDYTIEVKGAHGPFLLILLTNYDKSWSAFIEESRVPDRYHFVANGFFNGWIIIPPKNSFKIMLKYNAQEGIVYVLLTTISTMFLVSLIILKVSKLTEKTKHG